MFGTGQDSQGGNDEAGAGGGWFGGYTIANCNAGAGGGSSFILCENATIPTSVNYAFTTNSQYLMKLHGYANGIWSGNGKIIITYLSKSNKINTFNPTTKYNYNFFVLVILFSRNK